MVRIRQMNALKNYFKLIKACCSTQAWSYAALGLSHIYSGPLEGEDDDDNELLQAMTSCDPWGVLCVCMCVHACICVCVYDFF